MKLTVTCNEVSKLPDHPRTMTGTENPLRFLLFPGFIESNFILNSRSCIINHKNKHNALLHPRYFIPTREQITRHLFDFITKIESTSFAFTIFFRKSSNKLTKQHSQTMIEGHRDLRLYLPSFHQKNYVFKENILDVIAQLSEAS